MNTAMNFQFHIFFSDSSRVKDEYYLFCEKLKVFICFFKHEDCELRKKKDFEKNKLLS